MLTIDAKVLTSLKRNLPWYCIIVLCSVVIFQQRRIDNYASENRSLYKGIIARDSTIKSKDQETLAVYQKFVLDMNSVLLNQKLEEIKKAPVTN